MTEIYDSEDLATFSTGLGPDETLTKAHLAELLTQEFGYSKRQSRNIVDLFFDQLRACLERINQALRLRKLSIKGQTGKTWKESQDR